jgi:hypothetical protein
MDNCTPLCLLGSVRGSSPLPVGAWRLGRGGWPVFRMFIPRSGIRAESPADASAWPVIPVPAVVAAGLLRFRTGTWASGGRILSEVGEGCGLADGESPRTPIRKPLHRDPGKPCPAQDAGPPRSAQFDKTVPSRPSPANPVQPPSSPIAKVHVEPAVVPASSARYTCPAKVASFFCVFLARNRNSLFLKT